MGTDDRVKGTSFMPPFYPASINAEYPRKTLSVQASWTSVPKNRYKGGEVVKLYKDSTSTGIPELAVDLEPQISTTTVVGERVVRASSGVAAQTAGNRRKSGVSSGSKMAAEWSDAKREFEISDGGVEWYHITHGTTSKYMHVLLVYQDQDLGNNFCVRERG